MPKISIVAPVYGVEKYIDQFLESIRRQTFRDFEIILVDDGSKDNCPSILDVFSKEDDRYHVIHQSNRGVAVARNTGLCQILGEYVYIVDSDDWLEPTALEVLWNEAQRTNADLIYGDWISEQEMTSVLQRVFNKPFVTENQDVIDALQFAVNGNNFKIRLQNSLFDEINHLGGAPWRCMIKTSLIMDNNLRFDPYVRGLGDDILFFLHLYEYVKKVAYVPRVIYHYRKLSTSYSHGYKENYIDSISRILEKQEEFLKIYNKGELAWKSYYMRVLIYLQQGMERYFKNDGNLKPEKERYLEFKKLIKTQPYRDAIKKAPLSMIGNRRLKYAMVLLKFSLYRGYWRFV